MNPLDRLTDTETTIAAISTPPGVGGIAVVRLSGPDAVTIADKVWEGKPLALALSHTAHFGNVLDTKGQVLDEAVATVFRAPKSFTGQDTVEFSVHGSKYVQQELVSALFKAGAVPARPGEFTRRALMSGKIQLTQAEAIADIIGSESRASHRLAMSQMKGNFDNRIQRLRSELVDLASLVELELDFAEEDVTFADRKLLLANAEEIKKQLSRLLDSFHTGNAIKSGIPVAIVGPTNAGKSSLLNALIDDDRAIVSDIHGTTRDTIEAVSLIGDYQYRFIDTAGLRETDDPIEKMGIERSRKAIEKAHIVIAVIDSTDTENGEKYAAEIGRLVTPEQFLIKVYNKGDISAQSSPEGQVISALTGKGIDALREQMVTAVENRLHPDATRNMDGAEDVIVSNLRHAQTLQVALDDVTRMIDALNDGLPGDLVARDIRSVIDTLSELTGRITSDEILGTIFSRFCIGK